MPHVCIDSNNTKLVYFKLIHRFSLLVIVTVLFCSSIVNSVDNKEKRIISTMFIKAEEELRNEKDKSQRAMDNKTRNLFFLLIISRLHHILE